MSNFWKSLNLPLINCEIELAKNCAKNRAISEISRKPAVERANPADETLTTSATFPMNNAKFSVALPVNDNIKFLDKIIARI